MLPESGFPPIGTQHLLIGSHAGSYPTNVNAAPHSTSAREQNPPCCSQGVATLHDDDSSNAQKYSNPEVDRLLDAGRVETDPSARADIYRKAATIIGDDCSYIYLYNPSVIQAWSKDMSGYEARRDKAIRFRTATVTEQQIRDTVE